MFISGDRVDNELLVKVVVFGKPFDNGIPLTVDKVLYKMFVERAIELDVVLG